jgi:hypothetical protein
MLAFLCDVLTTCVFILNIVHKLWIGLELPDRGRVSSLVSRLPFASVDPDPAFLLERKQGLEKYLQVYRYC